MEKAVLHLIASSLLFLSQNSPVRGSTEAASGMPAYHQAIDGYVQYVRTRNQTPVDYVMGLFQTYDLVVLCERSHPETTQYDMLHELIANTGFLQQAGHVFTECGTCALRADFDSFLTNDTLTDEQITARLQRIFRDFSWGVGHGRTNYYDLLRETYRLNRSLPRDLRVHIYPSDLHFNWQNATKESHSECMGQLGRRDRIMADNIIRVFDEIRQSSTRNKALVIMNYRHAFPHLTIERGGRVKTFENMTGYLMEAYPGKVANVMINNVRLMPGSTDNQAVISAIQDGKWDAAFAAAGNPNIGFDFKGSPFGKDDFDYFALPFPIGRTYEEVFTGFVFFKPLSEHRMSFGIPGVFDASFADEMLRRHRLTGRNPSPQQIAEEIQQSQTIRIVGYEDKSLFPRSDYGQRIQQWLAAGR